MNQAADGRRVGPNQSRDILLVVKGLIAIIVVLFLAGCFFLLLPAMVHRPQSNLDKCKTNLRSLGHALILYQARYGSNTEFPNTTGPELWVLLQSDDFNDLLDLPEAVLHCPQRFTQLPKGKSEYLGPATRVSDGMKGSTPLAADIPGNHPMNTPINVLFHAGNVDTIEFDHGLPEEKEGYESFFRKLRPQQRVQDYFSE
jgi:hypothetical protein